MVDETITVGSIEEPVEDSEEEISEDEHEENEDIEIDDGTSCRTVAAVDLEDLGMTHLVSRNQRNYIFSQLRELSLKII